MGLQETHTIVLYLSPNLYSTRAVLPSKMCTRLCLMYLILSFRDLGFLESYEAFRPSAHFEPRIEGENGRAVELDVSQFTSLSPLNKATP